MVLLRKRFLGLIKCIIYARNLMKGLVFAVYLGRSFLGLKEEKLSNLVPGSSWNASCNK